MTAKFIGAQLWFRLKCHEIDEMSRNISGPQMMICWFFPPAQRGFITEYHPSTFNEAFINVSLARSRPQKCDLSFESFEMTPVPS